MRRKGKEATRRKIWIAACLCVLSCGDSPPTTESLEFARATNRGKAHLETGDSALAIAAFQQAVDLSPTSAAAFRNLARALLVARDLESLATALDKAQSLDPESVAGIYITGLMHVRQSQPEPALAQFEKAVRLDPHTAALRFQLANAYQEAGRETDAIQHFRETLKLEPLHGAAHARLLAYARKRGDREEVEHRQRELLRLQKQFGDQSRSATQLEACEYTRVEPPTTSSQTKKGRSAPPSVRFQDATAELLGQVPPAAIPTVAAAIFETSAEGRYTLFTADAKGRASLLTPDEKGVFQRTLLDLELSPSVVSSDRLAVLVASVRSSVPYSTPSYPAPEVRNDILIVGDGGTQLLERTRSGGFEDTTKYAGLSDAKGNAARWVDFDHDGDVDLLLGSSSGLELWQNGSDGLFQNVAVEVGVDQEGRVSDLAAADFDNDVAIDLVIARGTEPTLLFKNQRTGNFALQPEPPGPWPAAERILVDDLDNDGYPDSVLIGQGRALVVPGRGGKRQEIKLGDLKAVTAALIDFDNDGWLDLFVAGTDDGPTPAARISLWRNNAAEGWSDVSSATGIDAIEASPPRQVLVADLDNDGDSDLLLVTQDGLRLLRNEGGNSNRQLKIRLVGTTTNPSGIGTRVEVRAGQFWAARTVSALPIEIGLGDKQQLDSVGMVWTNGVVDHEIQLTLPVEPLELVEKAVATGSCPFLYAYNGDGYRFVTDLLGGSPLGLSVRRGVALSADPEELVWIGDPSSLVPDGNHYTLQITEELREVLYLDEARLIAVDHAPDVEVHSTDRLMPPPFPDSELLSLRAPRLPKAAFGDDEIDRTQAVHAIDGVFSAPGKRLPAPLRGQTQPLTLTLDFGPIDDLRAPVLALTGWLQYGDASANIAISQHRSLEVVPPTLEMETADGRWQAVDVVVGRPAGKTKTIVVDLAGKLAPGVQRLRLRTSFEIRWDRIALFEQLPRDAVQIHSAQPATAKLQWRGYSDIRARAPHHPTTPDWNTVFERPPWRTTPEGWVTRYGDVLELVNDRDGRLALLHGGDALELRFATSDFPPLAASQTRSFFLYSVGWDKDADHNVIDGDTVDPLPVIAEAGDDWQIRYNTRWVPRRSPAREP